MPLKITHYEYDTFLVEADNRNIAIYHGAQF